MTGEVTARRFNEKTPDPMDRGLVFKSLAVTYSHMGRPHTTIGAERFHFRVRKGIGWFPLAIAARQIGIAFSNLKISDAQVPHYMSHQCFGVIWPSLTCN